MAGGTDRQPPSRQGVQIINDGEDDQMEITGYRRSTFRTVLIWICIVLSVGLVRLFFYWLPHLMVKATHTVCSMAHAQTVILRDQYEQYFVSRVETTDKPDNGQSSKWTEAGLTDLDIAWNSSQVIRYFITKKAKYLWHEEYSKFIKVRGIGNGVSCAYFHQQQGQTYEQAADRRTLYGVNNISVHVTPIIKLLLKEVVSPFYIFQVFSCSVWFSDEYYYYAGTILLVSSISITATIYQTRKMQRALRNTIHSSTIVTVSRGDGVYHDIPSEDLVPGDVIEIPRHGCIMQCDAVLITGNCIVNESMLTGESVPVTKTPLPNPKTTHEDSGIPFNLKDHSRHVFFCGTHVIQTRYYGGQKVLAVVFRTGFATAKGELVRSILHPKPVDFKFNKDTYKFIGILAAIAMMGFTYTIILMVIRGERASDIVIRALDLITIAVPPALPAALTVGIVFAQNRMKANGVYCISPRSINVCGSINTVCFDKTGTLTEDGLDMQGIVPVHHGQFGDEIRDVRHIGNGPFVVGMATCHSLTIIDDVLSGDPLELIMFQSIGWELIEPGEETSRFDVLCPTIVYPKTTNTSSKSDLGNGDKSNSEEYGIVRQFTFSSSLQRMSVIVRGLGADHYDVFTKGAPEMIASLCDNNTLPDDFHEVLMNYTKHGYRVLAMAYKPLPVKLKYAKLQQVQRGQVEHGLTFLGLIVMENRLKPETAPVINMLQDANVRSIMITGDNMLTALSVARECGMVRGQEPIILVQAFPPATDSYGNASAAPYVEYIYTDNMQDTHANGKTMLKDDLDLDIELGSPNFYHFAVTGKSWLALRKYFPELVDKVVTRGTIFARMSPDQKVQLVESLQDLGYYVGMCGDGANDCGALKTAHAGISLSEAEASVASPFTSKTPNISCIPTVIKEGRCALVTSFGIFKYMACYSLAQFTSVLILYWVGVNLTDFEFLYIDLVLLTTLSITFGRTKPYAKLDREPPLVSLMTLSPVLSISLQTLITIAVQIFFYFFVMQASWFVPWVEDTDDDTYASYENTSVYQASTYQYIIFAIIFSKGKPYRKHVFSNVWFLLNLIACFAITTWINIYPTDGVIDFFELKPPPSVTYRLIYVAGGAVNFVLAIAVEMFFIESRFMTVTLQKKFDNCFKSSTLRHEEVEHELSSTKAWPPVKRENLAGTFKRLDSAYQNISNVSQADIDDISMSSADSENVQANGGSINLLDDIPLQHLNTGGQLNPDSTLDSEQTLPISTKL